MPQKVDLYDGAYGNYESDMYRQIRMETYGEDFGQTGWATTEESRQIPLMLELRPDSFVLELGCGSGGYAVHLAEEIGCRLVGLDINVSGVSNGNRLALITGLASQVHFDTCDLSERLPFANDAFNAVFSSDVLCHLPGRLQVLREMLRVLKVGGRMVFSDALVVGGMLSNEEIAVRSSIGFYLYSPPGENERLMERAGFCQVRAMDTTAGAAEVAQRWHDAREKRTEELIVLEGNVKFEGLQRFLRSVYTLTGEERLQRFLYVASKGG